MTELSRKDILNQNPTLNQYQDLAYETALYPGQGEFQGLCYCLFKLGGEAGEVLEKMGKLLRDRGIEFGSNPKTWPTDVLENFKKELGDILWYIGGVGKELGFTMQEIAECNVAKLQSRQQRGVVHGSGDDR